VAILSLGSIRVGPGGAAATGRIVQVLAGEAVTAGEPGFKDPTSSTDSYLKSKANTGSRLFCDGVFLSDAASGAPVLFAYPSVTQGVDGFQAEWLYVRYPGLLTQNNAYFVAPSGGICLLADLGSSDAVMFVGLAASADLLLLNPTMTGYSKSGGALPS
jgi:hypothetical protein